MQVPHRESLELRVACFDTALVFVVELAEADCHLSAAGAWSRHDHQRARGLHVVVFAETVGGSDEGDIVRVALYQVMEIVANAQTLHAFAEGHGTGLTVVMGDDDGADEEASLLELRAQAQYVFVVGDAQVCTYLVLLDVGSADDNHDFGAVLQLAEHTQFAVGLEAGEHAAGVVVVEEFSAQFQI